MYNYDSFLMYFYGEKHDFFPLYLTVIPYFLIKTGSENRKLYFMLLRQKQK